MHHPEMILDLVAAVKAGRAQASFLSDLVGKEVGDKLLTANLQPLTNRLHPASSPAKAASQTSGAGAGKIVLTEKAAPRIGFRELITPTGPVVTLPGSAYSPHAINETDLKVGQTVTARVNFANLLDGPVSAAFDNTFGGEANVAEIESFTGTEGPSPNGGLQPVVDQYQMSGGPITIAAGQDASVFVKLKFTKPGTYASNLVLTGSGAEPWSLSIPVSARVTAVEKTSALVSSDQGRIFLDNTGNTYDLPITIETVGYTAPFKLTITPKNVPPGVTVDSFFLEIKHAGKTTETLHFKANEQSILDQWQTIQFVVDPGDGDKTTFSTQEEVVSGQKLYEYFSQNSGDSNWSGPSLLLRADGQYAVDGGTINQSYFNNITFDDFGFYFPEGGSQVHGYFNKILPEGGQLPVSPLHGVSAWIKANWKSIYNVMPYAFFYEENDAFTGPPTRTNPLPTNPSITIIQW